MFNGGEFSKILDEIFEKDEKEKEKAIKIYCKIWKHLENITLQNLKYKRAFEILKDTVDFNIFCREVKKGDGVEKTYFIIFGEVWVKISKEQYELLEELMKGE